MTSPQWKGGWAAGGGLLGVAIVWAVVSQQVAASILPEPWVVTGRLWELLSTSDLWGNTAVTLRNVLLSFLISLTGGVLTGLWAARSPMLRRALHPVIVLVEAAPHIAWLVLAVLWLGIGAGPPVLVGVSMALPLVYMATSHGLAQIDEGILDMAHVYRLSRWVRLTRILLPYLALTLVGAASGALSVTWRAVIMAEAFASDAGLGQSLWGGYLYGQITTVYAYVLWIVLLGLLLEYLLIHPARRGVEKRLRHD
ncbi:MAG: ABC transporter permease [Halorhodospira sp.]